MLRCYVNYNIKLLSDGGADCDGGDNDDADNDGDAFNHLLCRASFYINFGPRPCSGALYICNTA